MAWSEPKIHNTDGKHPNHHLIKTQSGHSIIVDDSDGNESIIVQHRTGSAIQFLPGGAVHIRTNDNKYEVVLGDNNVKITGGQNITVDGGGTMHVIGNYDMTVQGDMHTTVQGSHKMVVAGDMETVVNGNQANAVKGDMKTAVNGNQDNHVDGTMVSQADGGIGILSTNGGVYMAGEKIGVTGDSGVAVGSRGGQVALIAEGGDTIINGENVRINS